MVAGETFSSKLYIMWTVSKILKHEILTFNTKYQFTYFFTTYTVLMIKMFNENILGT